MTANYPTRLTHPRFGIRKIYVARVKGVPGQEALEKIRNGVFIDGKKTSPAEAVVVAKPGGHGIIRIEIHEGRKREIRKMLEAVGHRVDDLRRIEFAGLTVEGLNPGHWRFLDPREIERLREMTGLAQPRRPKDSNRPPMKKTSRPKPVSEARGRRGR